MISFLERRFEWISPARENSNGETTADIEREIISAILLQAVLLFENFLEMIIAIPLLELLLTFSLFLNAKHSRIAVIFISDFVEWNFNRQMRGEFPLRFIQW